MKRLAYIALLVLSGCAPAARTQSAGAAQEYPHLVSSGRVSPFTYREQFDDGVVCYRTARGAQVNGEPFLDGLSCVVLPK